MAFLHLCIQINNMLFKNQAAPEISTTSISGHKIDLSAFRGKKVLVKFHRFSGCPVARRQIDEYLSRQKDLNAASVETIIFLHNSPDKINPDYEQVPGLHVIADKQKKFYHLFGSQFLFSKLFSPASWIATFRSFIKGYYPRFNLFEGGIIGIPSDFLINEDGVIIDLHYGKHFGDSWSGSEVLKRLSSPQRLNSGLRV
jgi:peroxiredoxin